MSRSIVLWPLVMSLASGLVLSASAPASAYHRTSLQVDIGFFYSDLDPYGEWVEVRDHGWCFAPAVYSSWRPYSLGHWVWTDEYGWLWVSDEPFGWATYHYGRWYPDPMYGWVWVPGYEWGPSWVSWRYGGGYVGWAPLPPRVTWSAGFGFRVGGAEIDALIAPSSYTFVEERAFVDTNVRRRLVPVERNTTIIHATENVTDYRTVENRVVARGPRVERLERVIGRAVPRQHVVEVDSVKEAHRAHRGRDVAVFRPAVRQKPDAVPPHGKAKRHDLAERQPRPMPRAEAHPRGREAPREGREVRREALETRRQDEARRRALGRQHEAERRDIERQAAHARQQEQHERRQVQKQREDQEKEAHRQQARERQENERVRRDLERRQARQRDDMERQHRQEMRSRQDMADVERRQREEHRAMQERQQRERQQAESAREQARQEREAARGERRAEARGEGRGERPAKGKEARERPREKEKDKDKGKPDRNR